MAARIRATNITSCTRRSAMRGHALALQRLLLLLLLLLREAPKRLNCFFQTPLAASGSATGNRQCDGRSVSRPLGKMARRFPPRASAARYDRTAAHFAEPRGRTTPPNQVPEDRSEPPGDRSAPCLRGQQPLSSSGIGSGTALARYRLAQQPSPSPVFAPGHMGNEKFPVKPPFMETLPAT